MADIYSITSQIGSGAQSLLDRDKAALVKRLCNEVDKRWKGADTELLKKFCALYYANVPPDDLAERSISELYGAAISHWNYGLVKRPSEHHTRMYNPTVKQHGWMCKHTVVESVIDDSPFLVDSLQMELNRLDGTTHLIIHPVLQVKRDKAGKITDIEPSSVQLKGKSYLTEAWIHFEVDRTPSKADIKAQQQCLQYVIDDVINAVADWQDIRAALENVIAAERKKKNAGAQVEQRAFLEWVHDNHFILMGYQYYADDGLAYVADKQCSMGIIKKSRGALAKRFDLDDHVTPWHEFKVNNMRLTKLNVRATVHRSGYLDLISVPAYKAGKRVGLHVFVGLYTSAAYNLNPHNIPWIREKLESVRQKTNLDSASHSGKALKNILETYPRDELIQIDHQTLFEHTMSILHLQERQRTRMLVRTDPDKRFVACMVYVPRENYNTETRRRIQSILETEYSAEQCEFTVSLSENVLARIYFVLHTSGELPDLNLAALERQISVAALSWNDSLKNALVESFGEAQGTSHLKLYKAAFPAAYRDDFEAEIAAFDIEMIEGLSSDTKLAMHLYHPLETGGHEFRFKVYTLESSIHLSDVLPILENMGVHVLDEHPYPVSIADGRKVWVNDFGLSYNEGQDVNLAKLSDVFQAAFSAVLNGSAENDGFNKLVTQAELSWRQISVLRAYYKYLKQLKLPYSQAYVESSLSSHPSIANDFIALFEARFDPTKASVKLEATITERLHSALEQVENIDQDIIIRRYLDVLQATVRTNYFQQLTKGKFSPYTCYKIDCAKIAEMPAPRPMFEIFVYSPEFEGVHLRGGKVARGGLRWSDRVEDFRTEVLGLVKAQMVKNAVIVPTGAKGGFVLKHPPAEREKFMQHGVACYKSFIRALLDITDNYVDEKVIPPQGVVRHDDDDPYLVVAADKGTATFSDFANEISEEKDFWLRDAFASGGSVGYDHKKMGITAKGAWESVMRHFREMGIDTQSQSFSVIGIGDMSGDVFGNGMLLSQHIKLVAAFNHRHIFIDPNPNCETSYAERQRLFELPRSGWNDYDTTLLSDGGVIFERSAKKITLNKQCQKLANTSAKELTPDEFIRLLLKSSVDLIWNGGIGTYVRSSTETDLQVGDKSNDSVRVSAKELRCKVIGEGGNLGMTQLGRIEYARAGGRMNTDFIDNSAGVDCSDHEVNIKILLNKVVASGDLTVKQRNVLLASMTDDVSDLVLADNYDQTRALSLDLMTASAQFDLHTRLVKYWEKRGTLKRHIEALPTDDEIKQLQSKGQGLSRPELCVLLAYSKTELTSLLLDSDFVDADYLKDTVQHYFPGALQKKYAAEINLHPLKREIIATTLANAISNRVGSGFMFQLNEQTNVGWVAIAKAFVCVRDIFKLDSLWREIDQLDNKVDAAVQIDMLHVIEKLVEKATLWVLRNQVRPLDIARIVEEFSGGIDEFVNSMKEFLPSSDDYRVKRSTNLWCQKNVPEALADRVSKLDLLYSALDIVSVSKQMKVPIAKVASIYYQVGDLFQLPMLHEKLGNIISDNHWQSMAKAANFDDLYRAQRAIAAEILRHSKKKSTVDQQITNWMDNTSLARERYSALLESINAGKNYPELAIFVVVARELGNVVSASHALN